MSGMIIPLIVVSSAAAGSIRTLSARGRIFTDMIIFSYLLSGWCDSVPNHNYATMSHKLKIST